jgi:glycosyltransferase involved in cell wall biosynthesis
MHIGFLQAYFSRRDVGGGEVHTENLARALQQQGHRVTVFTDEPEERRDGIADIELREYRTPVKLNPVNELALAQRAMDDMSGCDVVTLTDISGWRGVDVSVPTAMIFHLVWHGWVARNGPFHRLLNRKPQAFLYRRMEEKICRKADAVVAISPNMREDILRIGERPDCLVEIPNGVDADRFCPGTDSYDTFTVYYQGRLVDMKNPDLLVEAVSLSNENWRLLIGGDGPMRDQLARLVRQHGLEDRVEFLGYVPENELPMRYRKADLFALPSTYEGMPLTVLEAAASGTPILASARAATDFVTDRMGVVVDLDPSAIADVIDELSRNPRKIENMSQAARERAEEYTWNDIAESYENLYRTLTA